MTRHLIHTIAAVAGIAALCGSAIATASGSPTAPSPCRTGDLSARIEPGNPGAGQRYATLELTNRSLHTCHTYGYVGMLFLNGGGHPQATNVVRDRTQQPQLVMLAPGARVATRLHWSVVQGVGDQGGHCATDPRRVEITPPDQYSHLVIAWRGGVVCERGRVDVTPLVRAG
jgi:Domain of unknown function (DUF4232)